VLSKPVFRDICSHTHRQMGSKNSSRREYRDPHSPLSDHYTMSNYLLGKGSSSVFMGEDNNTGEKVAIKVVKKSGTNESKRKNEVAILLRVQHENIINCYALFETEEYFFIVMELVLGGDLYDRVGERDHYPELEARIVTHQLFTALAYLHAIGIVHRDLKPENILLSNRNDIGPIKITDFGLSTVYSEDMRTACGSAAYVAPEVLSSRPYTPAVDIWSAGVVVYVMLSGYLPFYSENEAELLKMICKGDYKFHSPNWDNISADAKDLITRCLTLSPNRRITASRALKHRWMGCSVTCPEL